MKRNILALHLFSFFKGFMVLMPVIVLFFQSRGLSITEIFLLQSIFAFAVFILEIPTGFVGDKRGRKASLMLGVLVSVCGYIGFVYGYGLWQLALSEVILALGFSLVSGSDNALLYDSLLSIKKEKNYKKEVGRYYALSSGSEAIAGLVGGFLATYALVWPAYAQVATYCLALVILLFVVEPPRHKLDESVSAIRQFGGIMHDLRYKSPVVMALIVYGALIGVGTFAMTWFTQPYLSETGYDLLWFGVIRAIINGLVALFARQSHNIEQFLGKRKTLIGLLVAIVLGFLGLGLSMQAWGVAFIVFFLFARSLSTVVISDYVNDLISSDRRATIMSMQSLLMRGGFALLGPIMGYVADLWSLRTALLSSAVFFVVMGSILIWRMRKKVFH